MMSLVGLLPLLSITRLPPPVFHHCHLHKFLKSTSCRLICKHNNLKCRFYLFGVLTNPKPKVNHSHLAPAESKLRAARVDDGTAGDKIHLTSSIRSCCAASWKRKGWFLKKRIRRSEAKKIISLKQLSTLVWSEARIWHNAMHQFKFPFHGSFLIINYVNFSQRWSFPPSRRWCIVVSWQN